ncbi:hypothetical protein [Mycobacterium sp. Root265]|uniref:hypothetical protein n=1 Tax=Mycobacterium sp. Root265 TaxID=1736504 RepID=UPI000AB03276|nr:hypothetical protein [Mycobacterium sp. Root265]
MIVVRAVSTLAALSGAAVMLAGPASAEELSGMYDQYVQGSRQFTVLGTEQWPDPDTDSHWYLTLSPCGEGCTTVTSQTGGWTHEMRLIDGRWQFSRPNPAGATCDGVRQPSTFEYSYDPVTLTGTLRDASICRGLRAYSETPVSLIRTGA